METQIRDTAVEAARVLDALAVISHDLSCHSTGHPESKVLSARQVSEVCSAIDSAVVSLRRILELSDRAGHGPLSRA